MIGNSRLHWAWFVEETLQEAWDTQHLPASIVQQLAKCRTISDLPVEMLPPNFPDPRQFAIAGELPHATGSPAHLPTCSPAPRQFAQRGKPPHATGSPASPLPLYIASVVPNQTTLWQTYPKVHVINLDQVPLQGLYSTLGIDRALALWGAGETWSWPMLVIDAGTALTLTGGDANRYLVGGAILPGVGLQLQSLAQRTADLPFVEQDVLLPPRWALNTKEAIQSGVIYTIIAGMRDFIEAWWQEFPGSKIALTGGDRTLLLTYLQSQFPNVAGGVVAERNLIFWGMRSCWELRSRGADGQRISR